LPVVVVVAYMLTHRTCSVGIEHIWKLSLLPLDIIYIVSICGCVVM
jgi:hypothetical protein